MLNDYVGRKIKVYRKVKGISQQELGDEIQLSRASIVNIESGKQSASLSVIWKICEVIGVGADRILPLDNEHTTLSQDSTKEDLFLQLKKDDAEIIWSYLKDM